MGIFFMYIYPVIFSTYQSGMTYTTIQNISVPVVISTAKIWMSVMKLDMIASSGSIEFGFSLSCKVQTTTTVKIVLTALTTQIFTINELGLCYFVFNPEKLLAITPSARYTVGSFSGTNGNNAILSWTGSPGIIKSYNAIIGLTGFHYKGESWFNFEHIITPGLSLSATSTNRWLKLEFDFLVFEFFYCPDTTPFLLVATNLCYDICPVRYVNNQALLECKACPYDCYECLMDGTCTTCSSTLDFR